MDRYIFFFNDTATTEIYTLSLHDALPIFARLVVRLPRRLVEQIVGRVAVHHRLADDAAEPASLRFLEDRKSTRLNSSHANISYAVFCLKKNANNSTDSIHLNLILDCVRPP